MKKENLIIYYEAWEMECCGDFFKVGDIIEWPVVENQQVKLKLKTDVNPTINYCYSAHGDNIKPMQLKGVVRKIQLVYTKYESTKDDLFFVGVADRLVESEDSISQHEIIDRYKWSAYMVEIKPISLTNN